MIIQESTETSSGVIHSNQLYFCCLLLEVLASETMSFFATLQVFIFLVWLATISIKLMSA